MKKGKKIYSLTIVFDDKTEEIDHLIEEMYEDNPHPPCEEALSTLEEQYPDAPPNWFEDIIHEYYDSLLNTNVYGVA